MTERIVRPEVRRQVESGPIEVRGPRPAIVDGDRPPVLDEVDGEPETFIVGGKEFKLSRADLGIRLCADDVCLTIPGTANEILAILEFFTAIQDDKEAQSD